MRLVAAADWQDVMVALITLAGVLVNAAVVLYIAKQTRTPSKRTLGELVEETHTITAGKVVEQLQRINGHDEATPSPDAPAAEDAV